MTQQLIDSRYIFAVILAFAVTALSGPVLIPVLRRLKVGNTEREELKSHQKKTGTPTMGGLMILLAIIITSLFFISSYPKIIPILFVTAGFGVIGFFDDYLKVVLKRSDGLFAWQKMILEIVVTAVFAIYLARFSDIPLTMLVPFSHGVYADFGWLALPILFLAVIGTVNGANFTDGLDGLASSVTVLIATFFTVVAIGTQSGIEPITCAVVGALLGFLLFNVYPASVFMGDTGSLFLGGMVVAMGYLCKCPLILLPIGIVYVCETMSDIIQIGYFKITHGKRVFKMAPIHHHFEMCGWKEKKICVVFSFVNAIGCAVGLLILYFGVYNR